MKLASFLFSFMILFPALGIDGSSTSPLFGDVDTVFGGYNKRLKKWRSQHDEFYNKTREALHATNDEIVEAFAILQEKHMTLKKVPLFDKEFEALRTQLDLPERILKANCSLLVGSPSDAHLSPLNNLIDTLKVFIKRWKGPGGMVKSFSVAITIIRDYQLQWEQFASDIAGELSSHTLQISHHHKIYQLIGGTFFKWPTDLKRAFAESVESFNSLNLDWFSQLERVLNSLIHNFQVRGKILWKILIYELAKKSVDISQIPEYEKLQSNFFIDAYDGNNPLKVALQNPLVAGNNALAGVRSSTSTESNSDGSEPRSVASLSSTPPSLSLTPPSHRSASVPVPIPSLLLGDRDSPLYSSSLSTELPSSNRGVESRTPSTPQAVRSSPVPRGIHSSPSLVSNSPSSAAASKSLQFPHPRKGSSTHSSILQTDVNQLERELRATFAPSDNLNQINDELKIFSELLINGTIICESSLDNLVAYYEKFIAAYRSNLSSQWESLAPKARMRCINQPKVSLLTQSMATKACEIWRNGPLCFNNPDRSSLSRQTEDTSEPGWGHNIGNLWFMPSHPEMPDNTVPHLSLSLLETLFGIPKIAPIAFLAIDDITFLTPNAKSQTSSNSFMGRARHEDSVRDYFVDPTSYHEENCQYFVTVTEAMELPLGQFLMDISLGKASFSQIDSFSFGMEFLFSLLTGSSRPLESYALTKDTSGQTPHSCFILKRAGFSNLMAPLFQTMEDERYSFVGNNCLHYFPQVGDIIPLNVRKAFSSHNFILLLAIYLREKMEGTQSSCESIIKTYDLDIFHESSTVEFPLKKFQMHGLTASGRPHTISQIIKNADIMGQALENSDRDITYQELSERVNPQETYCAQLLYEKVIKSFREEKPIGVFFGTLIPLISSNPLPSIEAQDPAVELEELKRIAKLCYVKYDNAKYDTPDESPTLEGVIDKTQSAHESKRAQEFFRQLYPKMEKWAQMRRKVLYFLRDVLPETITKLRGACESLLSQNENPPYSLHELNMFSKSAAELFEQAKSASCTSFEELIGSLARNTQCFFGQRYHKWIDLGGIEAEHILTIFELLNEERHPLILKASQFDSRIFTPEFWQGPFVRHSRYQPICPTTELTHPVSEMIKDLILLADLSKSPPQTSIQIMGILLSLNPTPEKWHESWENIVRVFRKQYFALPPAVLSFARRLGLTAQEEHETFITAQTRLLNDYLFMGPRPRSTPLSSPSLGERAAASASTNSMSTTASDSASMLSVRSDLEQEGYVTLTSSPSSRAARAAASSSSPIITTNSPTSTRSTYHRASLSLQEQEEYAYSSLHQLICGIFPPKAIEDKNCLEAIFALLCLPEVRSTHPRSLGFASCESGRDGIFHRRPEVGGDHYLRTWSNEWVWCVLEKTVPSIDIRTKLTSHAPIPLCFKWLYLLNKYCPNILFNPWFISNFLDTFTCIQTLVLKLGTFPEIIEGIRPEIYYMVQSKLKLYAKKPDGGKITSMETDCGVSPVEGNNTEYDWKCSSGQTLSQLLAQAEQQHWDYLESPPLNHNDAAIVCLKKFRPDPSNIEAVIQTLVFASNFNIDIGQISPQHWQDDSLLTRIVDSSHEKRLECLKFVCLLRTQCDPARLVLQNLSSSAGKGLSLTLNGFHYTPSGECDLNLLTKLISLFPKITDLNIGNNGIRSLRPLKPCLSGLTNLTHLSLYGNPIHNPLPLFSLTKLTDLVLDNTCLPNLFLFALEQLVNPKAAKSSLPEIKFYTNDSTGRNKEREEFFNTNGSSTLLKRLKELTLDSAIPLSERADEILCILERLAEKWPQGGSFWNQVLGLVDFYEADLPKMCETLFSLCLPPYDPRPFAPRLVYALRFGLPSGTNPLGLGFVNSIGDNPACLKKLEITGTGLGLNFPPTLTRFVNLTDLVLSNCLQPTLLLYIPTLFQLQALDISYNEIASLEDLRTSDRLLKFPNLTIFIFSHNRLISGSDPRYNGITALLEMPNLHTLDLSHNCLTTPPLLSAENFNYLDLRHNRIKQYASSKNTETANKKIYTSPQEK